MKTKENVRDLARPLLRNIRNSPGDYYVNVHNDEFLSGGVRGRLVA